MCMSSVTLMELIYGAEASQAVERNLRAIEGFAARLDVLPYDDAVAAHTGQLRAELKKIGRPIGPYEEMIAGHARSLGLIVVTNNLCATRAPTILMAEAAQLRLAGHRISHEYRSQSLSLDVSNDGSVT